MKMAKASPEDLDMAMDLANVLDDIERGFFPTKLQSDEDAESERVEWIDTADRQQYERLFFGLKSLLNKGSISRVIWGMAVVCDPANECIDPDADTIEHHPKRQQLEQQVTELIAERDAAMKDAERWRTVELLMFLGNVELNQDEDGGYKILLFPAENIVDQGWEGNSPEQVVDAVKCYGQPEKQAETETTVPAILPKYRVPVFTFPPTHDIEAIENRVAEACAKACIKEAVQIVIDGPEERAYNNATSDCAEAIKSGAWRKYK